MKTAAFLAASLLCCGAWGSPDADSLFGAYELKLGKPGKQVEIGLVCGSETACTMTTHVQSGANVVKDVRPLRGIVPVENLVHANNALQYAIRQQSETIRNEEYAESMDRLRPVLSSNPTVAKCWDLNYPAPEYLLACKLSDTPEGSPPLYLFGTLVSNCGEAFCRYVINPMLPVK